MDFRPSFKKILSDKIAEDQGSTGIFNNTLASEPAHLSYLIGQIERTEIQLARFKYPHTPRLRPPHKLDAEQVLAFEFFKRIVTELSPSFTIIELRRAFRKAALRLHPDHGGNTQEFISLKMHYQVLLGFFTT